MIHNAIKHSSFQEKDYFGERLIQALNETSDIEYSLFKHVANFFNSYTNHDQIDLNDRIKWQILFAGRTRINEEGKVQFNSELGIEHLDNREFAIFYWIIFSYLSYCKKKFSMNPNLIKCSRSLLALLNNSIASSQKNNKIRSTEIIDCLNGIDDVDLNQYINNKFSFLIKLPHFVEKIETSNLEIKKTPAKLKRFNSLPNFKLIEDKNTDVILQSLKKNKEYKTAQGGSGIVHLYEKFAVKAYYNHNYLSELEKKNLSIFFIREIFALTLLNGVNEKFKMHCFNIKEKKIVMTRMYTQNALTRIKLSCKEDQANIITKSCFQLIDWLMEFHSLTLKTITNPNNTYTLSSLRKTHRELKSLYEFEDDLKKMPDGYFKSIINLFFNKFMKKEINSISTAFCNNDVSIMDFYPDENVLLDFNASGISPIMKELASFLVNTYFQLISLIEDDKYMRKEVFKDILHESIIRYQKNVKFSFNFDVGLLKIFVSHFMLKRSLYEKKESDIHLNLLNKIYKLLSPTCTNLRSIIDAIIDDEVL